MVNPNEAAIAIEFSCFGAAALPGVFEVELEDEPADCADVCPTYSAEMPVLF